MRPFLNHSDAPPNRSLSQQSEVIREDVHEVIREVICEVIGLGVIAEDIRPPTLKERFFARLLSVTVRALCATLRVTVEGEEEAMAALKAQNGGFLICWHGRTLFPTDRFRGRGYGTLISMSRDGSLMAQYQRNLGMVTIRGSTKRRGVLAAREVLTFLDKGGVMLMTPDGPRGPSHIVQSGVVFLAKKSGKGVIPGGVAASPCWHLNSWDKYLIPKPFARACIHFGDPFFVAPDESLEAAAERLAAVMNELETRAEASIKG